MSENVTMNLNCTQKQKNIVSCHKNMNQKYKKNTKQQNMHKGWTQVQYVIRWGQLYAHGEMFG